MSDEEKKAIEIIKFLQYKCIEENGTGTMSIYRIDDLANAIKIILNLIVKQQKEIEEIKAKIEKYKEKFKTEKRKNKIMSNEEKEAIWHLKNEHEIILYDIYECCEDFETERKVKVVLNLIKKQQKEIKEYKKIITEILQSLLEKE